MARTQDKLAEIEFYNNYGQDLQMDLSEEIYQDMFKMAEFNKVKPSYVLEVGCGKGEFGRRMAIMGHRVLGVDLNQKIIEEANKRKTENYTALVGDVEDPSLFKEGIFDVIFCGCILHHLPSIEKAIKNCSLWLKENGVILIIEPNGSNPFVYMFNKLGKTLGNFKKFAINIGTKNEVSLRWRYLSRILDMNGFKILFNKPYIFFFPRDLLDKEISSRILRISVAVKNSFFKFGWRYFPQKNRGITMIIKAVKHRVP